MKAYNSAEWRAARSSLPFMARSTCPNGFASLDNVQWHVNGEVILMTLLGGLGTFFGPVVGAVLVLSIQNYLASLGGVVTIVEGVVFATIVMTFRRGLVGELQPRLGSLLQASTKRSAFEQGPVDTVPAAKQSPDEVGSHIVS